MGIYTFFVRVEGKKGKNSDILFRVLRQFLSRILLSRGTTFELQPKAHNASYANGQ